MEENERKMNKIEATSRIDELIHQYAKDCFGDDAESIVANLKNGEQSSSWDEYPIEVAFSCKKDVSDDLIRNYYICRYIEYKLEYDKYEGVLYNEGLL